MQGRIHDPHKGDTMRKSIKTKVLLSILAVTMVTASLLTLVFYFKSAKMIEENYAESLYGRVGQTVTSMDKSMQEVYYVNVKAARNENLISAVRRYKGEGNPNILEEIAEILRSYRTQYKDLSSLYFIFPEENMAVTSEDYPVLKKDIPSDEIQKIKDIWEEEAAPVMMEDLVHDSGKQLSSVQDVTDEEGTVLGYLLANTDERNLYYEYLEPVYDSKVSQAVIVDKYSTIVSSKDYEEAGTEYRHAGEFPVKNGIAADTDNEIRIFYQAPFSGCSLYLAVQKSEVLKDLRQMQVFLIGVCILFLAVACVLASYITRMVYRPIKKVTDAVEKVGKGDLSLRVDVETEDEIGKFSEEFNHMLDYIEDLIAQVIREEQLKKDAELEALQYQITPHFMYNTLNSIKYAALLKGEKELGELIGDFVELLQASINKKGTFITVADELHILDNYIHLQEFRYQGSFDVTYDVDQEAHSCYIPRLILQPLVENAILHGMDTKEKKGELLIQGRINEDVLTLSVIDNGRGMTQEQIETLLKSRAKKTNGLSAIGVPNIKERLELYYGERGGIRYESGPEGTTATIFLPAADRI